MATQLFLLNVLADTHLGTDSTTLAAGNSGWLPRALSTTRGTGLNSASASTVTGATNGIELGAAGNLREWISPPVSAGVTIAGTITCNVWASENSMSANVAINVVVDVIRANATGTRNSNTIVQIAKTAFTTEAAVTTRAVNNFTVAPTSTVVNRGDRIRIRIFGDDSAASTMATGFTFDASYAGTTAAADGDTYVTFTETFAFETPPGALDQTTRTTQSSVGGTSIQQVGQSFSALNASLTEVRVWLATQGSPSDNLVLEIQTDSAGSPSGSVVGTVATVAAGSLTGTLTQYTYSTSITLTPSTTYWLVYRRSGSLDAANNYFWGQAGSVPGGWTTAQTYNGTTWSGTIASAATVRFGFATSTLYLTDTASDVATASVDREAWTSRGAGVQNDVTNTGAGWTAPIQVTDTAGGTVVDWFSKQLTAFTLVGMAVANIRALESSASANASLRCEIARVNSDGTSPTVWATWNVTPAVNSDFVTYGEIETTEAAYTANVSGDALAFTNGQRIRIRLSVEDSANAAMGASQTVTTYYAGTSAAASGDTYITLPQTVTEFVSGTPGSVIQTRRQRRASRFLTFR